MRSNHCAHNLSYNRHQTICSRCGKSFSLHESETKAADEARHVLVPDFCPFCGAKFQTAVSANHQKASEFILNNIRDGMNSIPSSPDKLLNFYYSISDGEVEVCDLQKGFCITADYQNQDSLAVYCLASKEIQSAIKTGAEIIDDLLISPNGFGFKKADATVSVFRFPEMESNIMTAEYIYFATAIMNKITDGTIASVFSLSELNLKAGEY